jgi:glycerol-3-phosphate dehydrogenase (NAD(P)+)
MLTTSHLRSLRSLLVLLALVLVTTSSLADARGRRGRRNRRARPTATTGTTPTTVAVIGAGNYGTSLAQRLALNGHKVKLWAHEAKVVAGIRRHGYNPLFLQGIALDSKVKPHGSLKKTLRGKKLVVVAVPSAHLARVAKQMAPFLDKDAVVVSATKGLSSQGGFSTMTEVLAKALKGRVDTRKLVAFSGPGFAKEIGQRKRTIVTVAAQDAKVAKRVKSLFDTGGSFAVETSRDVVGVQFWGAAKNPLAIVSGVLEGLGADRKTRQVVLGQAISELSQLASRHGARSSSFFTAAALGDIVLTSSAGSRNYRLGRSLGKGQTLPQIMSQMNGQVAEGVENAASFRKLGKRYGISTPAFEALTAVVSGTKPASALLGLAKHSATKNAAQRSATKAPSAKVWSRGVAMIETFAGLGAGLGLSFNPRAALMMQATRDVARLAKVKGGGSLLSVPQLAASVVLTNGSAAGPTYQQGQKLGAGKLAKPQLSALKRQVGSLLRDARQARIATPALQALDKALSQPEQLGKLFTTSGR